MTPSGFADKYQCSGESRCCRFLCTEYDDSRYLFIKLQGVMAQTTIILNLALDDANCELQTASALSKIPIYRTLDGPKNQRQRLGSENV
jgi:hypothetical protein